MNSVKIAFTSCDDISFAIMELKDAFHNYDSKVIIYFASSNYDLNLVASEMQSAFKNSLVFGCTTSGELVSGKMLDNSIVAMAFSSDIIEDIKVEVLEDLNDKYSVDKAFNNFEKYFKIPMVEMDFEKYVGITLIDGLSLAEERIIDRIGDLTNVLFVGGSAGDDLKFKQTTVFANGKAYNNSAILALIKPKHGYEIIKTQSFKVLDKKLTPTKVDSKTRTVYEFNGIPASKAYAEAVGAKDITDTANYAMHNPVGLLVNGEPFVRSPMRINEEGVTFYCNVSEEMELALLESGDIVEETKKVLDEKLKAIPHVSGMLNFHCILRTLELKEKDQTKAYGELFKDIPTIGFSTYGEQYLGHINQTSTILVFKG